MTEYEVMYSGEAMKDLQAIYRYIADELQAPQAARGQTDRIQDAAERLGHAPSRHQLVAWDPWHSMGLRQLPVDRFMVYYLTDDETMTVSIVRILYGGRDVKRVLADSL